MNILYATPEAAPFVKTGGLADVAGSLPQALKDKGANCAVILPLYDQISWEFRDKMDFVMYTYIGFAWRWQYCGLFSLERDGVIYYFIDNEYYFKRVNAYGYFDDAERFAFFSRAVTDILPRLEWKPDVISCNDWQTALIPLYVRLAQDDYYRGIKTVFTIHNIEYQGRYGRDILWDVFGLPNEIYDSGILRYDDDINLMKGAIYTADYVTTVSPTYAMELQNPYHGCGLHAVIAENSHKLRGILNGIDTKLYNPETDKHIWRTYSAKRIEGKELNKRELQRELGLDIQEDAPIVACVTRLVGHKGIDLISEALERILQMGAQLIILGTGEWRYERRFMEAAWHNPGRVSANIMYSDALASKIYAGADILLMPSKSEPCGLSQMIAMRYGTIPVVREAGGLRDSVRPYPAGDSNGFTFAPYSTHDMIYVLREALALYIGERQEWKRLLVRAMSEDFGWGRSAAEYMEIYRNLCS